MIKKYTLGLLLFGLSTQVHSAASPFSLNLSAGVLHDDNVARASLSNDIESDLILNFGAMGDYQQHLSEHSIIKLSASLDAFEYQDFEKLSNQVLSGKATYSIQPHHAYTSPWYFASFEYSLVNYDSTLRDSDGYTVEIGLGKRITDRVSMRTAVSYEDFSADADEFSIENKHIYLNLDFKTSQKNILYITLGYTDGQVASTTSDTTPAAGGNNKPAPQSKPGNLPRQAHHLPNEIPSANLRPDDAFSNGFVYQLDSDALSVQLGDNYAISSHQSIDASLFYYDADSEGSADYDGIIAQLLYIHRF